MVWPGQREKVQRWRPASLVELLDLLTWGLLLLAVAPVLLVRAEVPLAGAVALAGLGLAVLGVRGRIERTRQDRRLRALTWRDPLGQDALLMPDRQVWLRRGPLLCLAVAGVTLLLPWLAAETDDDTLYLFVVIASSEVLSGAWRWRDQVRWERAHDARLFVPASRPTRAWDYAWRRSS